MRLRSSRVLCPLWLQCSLLQSCGVSAAQVGQPRTLDPDDLRRCARRPPPRSAKCAAQLHAERDAQGTDSAVRKRAERRRTETERRRQRDRRAAVPGCSLKPISAEGRRAGAAGVCAVMAVSGSSGSQWPLVEQQADGEEGGGVAVGLQPARRCRGGRWAGGEPEETAMTTPVADGEKAVATRRWALGAPVRSAVDSRATASALRPQWPGHCDQGARLWRAGAAQSSRRAKQRQQPSQGIGCKASVRQLKLIFESWLRVIGWTGGAANKQDEWIYPFSAGWACNTSPSSSCKRNSRARAT